MRKLTTSLEPIQPNGFCRSSLEKIRHFLCFCVLLLGINSLSYGQTVAVTPTTTPTVEVCDGAMTATLDFMFSGFTGDPNEYSIDYDAAANASGVGFVDVLNNTSTVFTASPSSITLTIPTGAVAGTTYNGTLILANTTGSGSSMFSIFINPLPTATAASLEVCDTNADGIEPFTLTDADATVLGSQAAGSHTVTYHASQAEADAGTPVLGSTYTNATANSQTIYARVQVTATGCFTTSAVTLTVNPSPTAAPTTLELCDTNVDGIEPFTLTDADATVLGSQAGGSHTVTYHCL